jgi:soluble cytochrome b562
MRRSEKDRLTDFATWSDLEALKRNLEFTRNDLLKREEQATGAEKENLRDDISTELERMSLLSEEISKRLKAEELANSARDLLKGQERLMESLEKLRSGDKNLDAVMKQLSEMAKMLSSLQQSLSQMASRLPEDFVNSEAMRGLGFSEMFSALQEIRKKLAQGDIEGAMQLARELFNQMASMVAALQGAQQSAMSSGMGRMQGEMMRSANELQQIAREQQEILVDTEDANKKALSEREDVLKEKLDRFMSKAYGELSRLAELFPDVESGGRSSQYPLDALDEATVNNLVKEMIGRLLKKNFSGFDEILGMAEKELGKTRAREQEAKGKQAEASLKGLKDELDSLLRIPPAALKDEERSGLRDLSRRQGTLKERTEELHEKLDSLFQLFPALDPQIARNIKEAGGSMGKAERRLGDLDSKGAVPPERRALEQLSQSQQQMQNAMQQLAQRGQLGRMAVSRLFRMGRMLPTGELVPLPGMPQFPQFDVEGGLTGLDTEKFRLPGKEDYKAPRSFREEILESLKQGVPRQLKEQIESYFKNLSE